MSCVYIHSSPKQSENIIKRWTVSLKILCVFISKITIFDENLDADDPGWWPSILAPGQQKQQGRPTPYYIRSILFVTNKFMNLQVYFKAIHEFFSSFTCYILELQTTSPIFLTGVKIYNSVPPVKFICIFQEEPLTKFTCLETVSGLILGLCPANERRRYKVTPSLIGCAQTLISPVSMLSVFGLPLCVCWEVAAILLWATLAVEFRLGGGGTLLSKVCWPADPVLLPRLPGAVGHPLPQVDKWLQTTPRLASNPAWWMAALRKHDTQMWPS